MKKLRLLALTLLLTIITLPMLTTALPTINLELNIAAEASPDLFTLTLTPTAVYNNTEYTFEVAAYNSFGISSPAVKIHVKTKDDFAWLIPVHYLILN